MEVVRDVWRQPLEILTIAVRFFQVLVADCVQSRPIRARSVPPVSHDARFAHNMNTMIYMNTMI